MYDPTERLTTEWASARRTVLAIRDVDLARWILLQLADPTSDYGEVSHHFSKE
jgi:hypothetical protein